MFMDLSRAQAILRKKDIDVILSNRPENITYVSGVADNLEFRINREERTYALVFRSEPPALVAQWFEVPYLRMRSKIETIVSDKVWKKAPSPEVPEGLLQGDVETTIAEVVRERHLSNGRIGVDERAIPLLAFQRLQNQLPKATFVPAASIFEELRTVKTSVEVSLIEKAIQIVEKGYQTLQEHLQEDVTERELTLKVRDAILGAGADEIVFNFVTSGSRAGIDHVTGADIRIKTGEIIKCDIGARYGGYCSDIGRSFACGNASQDQKRIYQRILETEQEVLAAAKPGMTGSDLFRIYLKGMREGYGDVPWDMIGHGIGLELHEAPRISLQNHTPLQPGMVICVEIGYLEPGQQGYHLEDMILITEDGHRPMTSFPREYLL